MTIQQLEEQIREASLLETKLRINERRTGIPREEYKKDEDYIKKLKLLAKKYKAKSNSCDFIVSIPTRLQCGD
tara:strand:- start:10110 stop:10328 length:219 start_codon:yes stop_codon:yes gene_type:complete